MFTFSAPKAFHVSISFEVSSISFEVSSLSIANLFSNLSECFPFSMSNDLIIPLPAQLFGEVQVREKERERERERERGRERQRDPFPLVGAVANETKRSKKSQTQDVSINSFG